MGLPFWESPSHLDWIPSDSDQFGQGSRVMSWIVRVEREGEFVQVREIEEGETERPRTLLEPPNGIRSHDIFTQSLSRLDPERSQKSVMAWSQGMADLLSGRTSLTWGSVCPGRAGRAWLTHGDTVLGFHDGDYCPRHPVVHAAAQIRGPAAPSSP